MTSPTDHDPLLEMLLAGSPVQVTDMVALAAGGVPARAELDALREDLAALGLSLPPVAPSAGLRDRIARAIGTLPARRSRRAALVVMDMLVDHLTPGGPLEVPRARAIVPAVQSRIANARAAGEPVVYLCDHHDPGDPELDAWPLHNTGSPQEDVWPPLAPVAGDVVVTHRSYSGFFETDLHAVLRGLDVNTVVLTGCITELNLFVTATDALQRGYTVELPAESQAGSAPVAEQVVLAALSIMRPTEPLRSP